MRTLRRVLASLALVLVLVAGAIGVGEEPAGAFQLDPYTYSQPLQYGSCTMIIGYGNYAGAAFADALFLEGCSGWSGVVVMGIKPNVPNAEHQCLYITAVFDPFAPGCDEISSPLGGVRAFFTTSGWTAWGVKGLLCPNVPPPGPACVYWQATILG